MTLFIASGPQVLNLEKATIAGQLSSDDPVETYFLDLPPEINGGRKAAVGIAVENCQVEGGEGPLLDLSLQAEGWKPNSEIDSW